MTPFEQCEIKLHVRLPIDVMRQWVRHRTAHVNEYSTRYSEAIDSQHCVDVDEWRLQSSTNRQGSGATLGNWESVPTDAKQVAQLKCLEQRMIKCDSPGLYLSLQQSNLHQQARDTYEEQLAFGVAREQARAVLPLSTYTEIYWKCDLRNCSASCNSAWRPTLKGDSEYATRSKLLSGGCRNGERSTTGSTGDVSGSRQL